MKNLTGMTFCITGTLSKSRSYFVRLIEQAGGVFKRDISNMVTFLIVGSIRSLCRSLGLVLFADGIHSCGCNSYQLAVNWPECNIV